MQGRRIRLKAARGTASEKCRPTSAGGVQRDDRGDAGFQLPEACAKRPDGVGAGERAFSGWSVVVVISRQSLVVGRHLKQIPRSRFLAALGMTKVGGSVP